MPEPLEPLPLKIGGLLRCCVETWREIAPDAIDTSEGDTLACSYCTGSMIVRGGYWVWNRPKEFDDKLTQALNEMREDER